jgi:MinD-like ATPase involved in chromosome partitioning or flagellar assembly
MTVFVIGSMHGSPGVTTFAVDLARAASARHERETLLVEADPDGGCLAARLDLAVRPGLTELAGAARVGICPDDLWKFAQPTSIGVAVVVAHPAAEQVQAALRAAASHIGNALEATGQTVVIDVGRLRPGSPALPLAALADHTLIVSHNNVESIVSLTHRATLLHGLARPRVVLTESKPYSTRDIEAATRQSVWGTVPRGTTHKSARARQNTLEQLLLELDGGDTVAEEFDVAALDDAELMVSR